MNKKPCQVCGHEIKKKRFYKYCSVKCRNKRNYDKHKLYFKAWQRDRNDKIAERKSENKVRCLVCGRWYVQLGTHVIARHGFETARQYKEYFDLERKKGIIPLWYKELKGNLAKENGTYKNLKAGKKFRFKKGDPLVGRYKRSKTTIENLKRNLAKGRRKKRIKKINKI